MGIMTPIHQMQKYYFTFILCVKKGKTWKCLSKDKLRWLAIERVSDYVENDINFD